MTIAATETIRDPVASALMARMRIAPGDRPRVKLECLRMLATLRLDPARTRLISGFVDAYLQLSAPESQRFRTVLQESGLEQEEHVMEIMTSWKLEGLIQGRQEGREEVVLRQLSRRCGTVPDSVRERIHNLSSEQLGDLGEALLDFHDLSDAESWLARFI